MKPSNLDIETPTAGYHRRWVFFALLGGLLLLHLGITRFVGWENTNLYGNEFRQTQTAISAMFIQRENNFSLAYPTPVLGKPWSAPLEFPLYQWTVVKLSNWTGCGLVQSGRWVSLLCFYLMLPALFINLGFLGFGVERRLLVLMLIVTSPIYIFYSRAFLIETMALMFALWFLVCFGQMLKKRSLGWLVLASLAGVLAGMVKVTTLVIILLPAGLWTVHEIWARRRDRGWARRGVGVTCYALGSVVLPLVATVWWTHFADGIKSRQIGTEFLVSGNLLDFTLGTNANRFSSATLGQHWRNLTNSIASIPLLIQLVVLTPTVSARWWRPIALCLACYLATLILFPTLFAWHDYYAVANGFLILSAAGLALGGLMEFRRTVWLGWFLLIAVMGTQGWNYGQDFYKKQSVASPGGGNLTILLREISNPDDVLVVAGDDWSSILPYYSERRALMIRSGKEHDWAYLNQACENLKGEAVTMYVAFDVQRQNQELRGLLSQNFGLSEKPAFSWGNADVYVRSDRWPLIVDTLRNLPPDAGFVLSPEMNQTPSGIVGRLIETKTLLPKDLASLALLSPRPSQYFAQFGLRLAVDDGRPVMLAHPDAKFWFEPPEGRVTVRAEVGIGPAAYGPEVTDGDATDGVEFSIFRESPNGERELVGSLLLRPRQQEADRGFHELVRTLRVGAGDRILFQTGPGPAGNFARDWAEIARVSISPANQTDGIN